MFALFHKAPDSFTNQRIVMSTDGENEGKNNILSSAHILIRESNFIIV